MASRAVLLTTLVATLVAAEASAKQRLPLVRLDDFVSVRRQPATRLAGSTASPSWRAGRGVRRLEHTFTTRAAPDAVWRVLTDGDPVALWRSGVTSFRLAFARGAGAPMVGWTGLREGMTLFLDLHGVPFTGLADEAIGLRITRVDPVRREIRFRYTDVAPVFGEQTLRVEAVGEGSRVVHVSEFSGRSHLTNLLYRPFHGLALRSLYRTVFREASR